MLARVGSGCICRGVGSLFNKKIPHNSIREHKCKSAKCGIATDL